MRHRQRRQPAAASGVIRHRRTDPQSRYLSRGVPRAVNNRVLSRAPSAVKRRVTAPREGDPATLGVGKLRHTYTRPGAVRARCLPACLGSEVTNPDLGPPLPLPQSPVKTNALSPCSLEGERFTTFFFFFFLNLQSQRPQVPITKRYLLPVNRATDSMER